MKKTNKLRLCKLEAQQNRRHGLKWANTPKSLNCLKSFSWQLPESEVPHTNASHKWKSALERTTVYELYSEKPKVLIRSDKLSHPW